MLSLLAAGAVLFGPAVAAPAAEPRVGRVIIEGNVVTKDSLILEEFPFRPGQLLPDEAKLLKVEIRLLMKFHKRFDLDGAERPTIQVLENEFASEYRDILIRFPEKGPKKPKR